MLNIPLSWRGNNMSAPVRKVDVTDSSCGGRKGSGDAGWALILLTSEVLAFVERISTSVRAAGCPGRSVPGIFTDRFKEVVRVEWLGKRIVHAMIQRLLLHVRGS
jgi:hypothetical protein